MAGTLTDTKTDKPGTGRVCVESFSHQYAILLLDYGIAFSQAVILIVSNFGILLKRRVILAFGQ